MNSGSNWKRWKWPFKTHDSESRLALGEEERLAGGGGGEFVKGTGDKDGPSKLCMDVWK